MATTVLIVDDDPLARRLLEHHLRAGGYRLIVAESGEDAVEALRHEFPDMVITDWNMPGMSGPDLCRHIRTIEGIGWIYTIVLTTESDTDRVVEAFDAGADDYLTKPFNQRELLARLRAGQRIVDLERDLAKKTQEIVRSNAELEYANQKLARVNTQLNRSASTDDLTGLGNRRAAIAGIELAWERSQKNDTPLSCILFDIDHFKRVNDTYGHAIGDLVLVEVASMLRSTVGRQGKVFRLGGEEFLVLCAKADAATTLELAEVVRGAVADRAIDLPDGHIRITISGGVSERVESMRSADHLLKVADDALYAAKDAGRNCIRPESGIAPTSGLTPEHRASA